MNNNVNRRPLKESFVLLNLGLGVLVSILFIVLGTAIIIGWLVAPSGSDMSMKLFAALMLLYGIYRAIRVYFYYKRIKQDENR